MCDLRLTTPVERSRGLGLLPGRSLGRGWRAVANGLVCAWVLLPARPLFAQTGDPTPGEIPPFRPPKPEMPPGFWEQHGLWVALGAVALALVVAVLWRLITRRPPPRQPTPAETARAVLDGLRSHSGEPRLPDQVSGVLRSYFVAVFGLPVREFTNRELASELQAHPRAGFELAQRISTLLSELDQCRFDPQSNTTATGAVEEGMRLVDLTEARLQPAPAPPPEGVSSGAPAS